MPRQRLFPPPPPQGRGQRWRPKGRHDRTILTSTDRITVWRTRWSVPALGSHPPADAWVAVAEATVSLGVRGWACRRHQASSNFAKAAAHLARTAQVPRRGEELRQVVEAEGQAVRKAPPRGPLRLDGKASDGRVEATAAGVSATGLTRVSLGSAGVKVAVVTDAEQKARRHQVQERRRRRGRECRPRPRAKAGADQQHKEFEIVAYDDDNQAHRQVVVTRGDGRVAGPLRRREARRLALDQADAHVALVGGADWMRHQLRRHGLPLDGLGLDCYHSAGYVHQSRRGVYGAESADGQAWAAETLHLAEHDGDAALGGRLRRGRHQLRSPPTRPAADRRLHDVSERQDLIAYPALPAQGGQIGRGPTEAMGQTTTARRKRSGRRGDADNAEAITALEALGQSGQWQRYWGMQLAMAAELRPEVLPHPFAALPGFFLAFLIRITDNNLLKPFPPSLFVREIEGWLCRIRCVVFGYVRPRTTVRGPTRGQGKVDPTGPWRLKFSKAACVQA